MARTRIPEIIRGDDQNINIPTQGVFPNLAGATAYLFIVPKGNQISNVVIDPNAVSKSVVTGLTSATTEINFPFSSTVGVDNTSVIPLNTYGWYGRIVSASNLVTTFRFDSEVVEVTAPQGSF